MQHFTFYTNQCPMWHKGVHCDKKNIDDHKQCLPSGAFNDLEQKGSTLFQFLGDILFLKKLDSAKTKKKLPRYWLGVPCDTNDKNIFYAHIFFSKKALSQLSCTQPLLHYFFYIQTCYTSSSLHTSIQDWINYNPVDDKVCHTRHLKFIPSFLTAWRIILIFLLMRS